MAEPTIEEIREWVISRKWKYSGPGMTSLPKWQREFNDDVDKNNKIIDALLAILSERERGGAVTEEGVFCLQAELRRIDDNVTKESGPFAEERSDDLQFEYLKSWLESKGIKVIREAGAAGEEK